MARAQGEAPAGSAQDALPAVPRAGAPRTLLSAQAGWAAHKPSPAPAERTYLYTALPAEPKPAALRTFSTSPASLWLRGGRVAGKAVLLAGVAATALLTPAGPGIAPLEHRLPWEQAASVTEAEGLYLPPASVSDLQLTSAEAELLPADDSAAPTPVQTGASYGRPDLPPVPAVVLAAYRAAAAELAAADPTCGVSWQVLAGIGAVESRHAVSGGSLGAGWNGVANPPILGPRLDGSAAGTARIGDTDGGRLDGDPEVDRAVGPMQFLPGTWAAYGTGDPQDVDQAALAAARYLCAGSADLRDPLQLAGALFRYNRSDTYVRKVLALSSAYLGAELVSGPEAVSATAIAFAYARLGDPYLWGGTGPLYDCSGLTQAAFRSAGVALPRTAAEQWVGLPAVSPDDLRPGDLVFFQLGARIANMPGHVAIYLGNGRTVEAPYTGSTVRIGTVAHSGPLVGVRRPAALADPEAAPLGTSFLAPETSPQPTPTATATPLPSASPVPAPSPELVPPAVEALPSPSLPAPSEPAPAEPTPSGPVPEPSGNLSPEPAPLEAERTAEPGDVAVDLPAEPQVSATP